MTDVLFDTWEGDDSTLESDLARVLSKHGVTTQGLSGSGLTTFVMSTLRALEAADGSTSEFTTSMFMLYKELEIGQRKAGRNVYGVAARGAPRGEPAVLVKSGQR